MAVRDAYVFPGFPTRTTFLTCFCRGERRKYARKKSRLNQGSNSQPLGCESDTLTTEPPGWASTERIDVCGKVLIHPQKVLMCGKDLMRPQKVLTCGKDLMHPQSVDVW